MADLANAIHPISVPRPRSNPGPVARPAPAAAATTGGALTGAQDDAYRLILNVFTQYGLGSLAPKIMEFLRKGYSSDRVALELQNTKEYQQRFSGNEARRKAGLPVLSPAEYLSTEDSYRQIMQAAGVPKGFYDSPNDFAGFIGNGVSPAEIQGRVTAATDMINKANPQELAYFKKFYTHGDLIAFALDPTKAAPLVGKAFAAAGVGGAAASQGIGIDRATAESLAGMGIDANSANQGFSQIASDRPQASKLSAIYGDSYTQDQQIADVFKNDAAAGEQRKKLASKERAAFGNASAMGNTSLSQSTGGQL